LTRGVAVLALLCGLLVQAPAPPASPGGVRIASPEDGSYLTGAVRFTLAFEPMSLGSQARQVRWFANGRLVCTVTAPPFSCEWDAGEMIKEHVIRAVVTLDGDRQLIANARTRAVQFAEAVDVDVVQVTAIVTDGSGKFVTGLKAGDFKVYEDGHEQAVSSFAAENVPLELVTAIDVSSSMTAALPDVRRHAGHFLAQLEPADQVTILGFNDKIFTLVRRSTDRAARARAVERLAPWGGTALYDAIVHALGILGRQSGRRSLVVFSDGEDHSSHAAVDTVIQRAEASDATIYVIGQGQALKNTALQQLMHRLAAGSGGRAFFTAQDTKLDAIFEDILADLRHQYVLAYAAPATARNGEWHAIRVEVPDRGYTVRARLGYRLARRIPQ